jgi:hypothetical protein
MRFIIATSLAVVAGIAIIVSILRVIIGDRGPRRIEGGSISPDWLAQHRSNSDDANR